jgi:hypothetical protein
MLTHVFGLCAVVAAVILCTVLPFLPGGYDRLALPLSLMAQLFGKAGLLLVPIGFVWLVTERRSRRPRTRYAFAIVALGAGSLVWALVSVGALVESRVLGIGVLALGAFVVVTILRRVRVSRNAAIGRPSAVPLYLIVVPTAVALVQYVIAGPVTEFSRDCAIRNAAPLVADIERYRAANGRYPESLLSLWPDYKPSIVGIRAYQYEPSGDAYNVKFEQPTFILGTNEIVVYNPRDEHTATSHAMDLLQLSPARLALERRRGHYAVHDTRHPHWKYFWFD